MGRRNIYANCAAPSFDITHSFAVLEHLRCIQSSASRDGDIPGRDCEESMSQLMIKYNNFIVLITGVHIIPFQLHKKPAMLGNVPDTTKGTTTKLSDL